MERQTHGARRGNMERQTHGAGRDSAGFSHNDSQRVTTILIPFFASLRDGVGGKGEVANIDDGARVSSCLDVETWKGKRMALDVETWKGKRIAPAGIQQDSHTRFTKRHN